MVHRLHKLGDEVRGRGAALARAEIRDLLGCCAAEGSLMWESSNEADGDATEAKDDPYSGYPSYL